MTWDFEKHAIEAAEKAGCAVLTPEEDEPDFGPLVERAKARAEAGGEDGELVRQLLDMIDHLQGEIDSMEHHISEGNMYFEDRD